MNGKNENDHGFQPRQINPWEGMTVEEMNTLAIRVGHLGREINNAIASEKSIRGIMREPVLRNSDDSVFVTNISEEFADCVMRNDYMGVLKVWDQMVGIVNVRSENNRKKSRDMGKKFIKSEDETEEKNDQFEQVLANTLSTTYPLWEDDDGSLYISSRNGGLEFIERSLMGTVMNVHFTGGNGNEEQQRKFNEHIAQYKDNIAVAKNTTLCLTSDGIIIDSHKRIGDSFNDFRLSWEDVSEMGMTISYVGPDFFEPLNQIKSVFTKSSRQIAPFGLLSVYFPQGMDQDNQIPEFAFVMVKKPEMWVELFNRLKKNSEKEREIKSYSLGEVLYLQHFVEYSVGMEFGLKNFMEDVELQRELALVAGNDNRAEVQRRLAIETELRIRPKHFWNK